MKVVRSKEESAGWMQAADITMLFNGITYTNARFTSSLSSSLNLLYRVIDSLRALTGTSIDFSRFVISSSSSSSSIRHLCYILLDLSSFRVVDSLIRNDQDRVYSVTSDVYFSLFLFEANLVLNDESLLDDHPGDSGMYEK